MPSVVLSRKTLKHVVGICLSILVRRSGYGYMRVSLIGAYFTVYRRIWLDGRVFRATPVGFHTATLAILPFSVRSAATEPVTSAATFQSGFYQRTVLAACV